MKKPNKARPLQDFHDDDYHRSTSPDDMRTTPMYAEICPVGHIGRGILLEAEPIECENGDLLDRLKFECELCGEIWWEDDCDD